MKTFNLRSVPAILLVLPPLFYLCTILPSSAAEEVRGSRAPLKLRTITSAGEVHSLTTREAGRNYPVRIRGVVTSADPSTGPGFSAVFVHDDTGSVYVMVPDSLIEVLTPGSNVEVRGMTEPGGFAPIIDHTQSRVVGHTNLPKALGSEKFFDLATGAEDGKWVAAEGIVHSIVEHRQDNKTSRDYTTLELAMKGGIVGVSMLTQPGFNYSSLVDAKVRILANAAPMFNRNAQVMGARLMCPGLLAVTVLKPAPQDPFGQPTVAIDDLLRWDEIATGLHRIHVRGAVTMLWPHVAVCLRDRGRGICAQTVSGTHLALGEVVDVVAFVGVLDGSPLLTDAVYKNSGHRESIAAIPVTAERALQGEIRDLPVRPKSQSDYDSELIEIEGKLIGVDLTSPDTAILLASGKTIFTAILPRSLSGSAPPPLGIGSRIRVTGICSVKLDSTSSIGGGGVATAKLFRVLMRSPADLVVLQRPSWWTPFHAIWVLVFAIVGTLIVLAWVVALRQRVVQQTCLLRQSEERFRNLALRDSLTGVATRVLLQDRLSVAFERAKRVRSLLALFMLDLDTFKEINDGFGHAAGDQVLRRTADRILKCVRECDTVARMGGDEFVVMLADMPNRESAEAVAQKLVLALSEPVSFENREIAVSVSVGVFLTFGEEGPEESLKRADIALYKAKAQGRCCFRVSDSESVCAQLDALQEEPQLSTSTLVARIS